MAPQRGEDPLALFAGEDRAARAHDAGRVQVLGVLLDVDEDYLLRDPVQDVLGARLAALARALLASQLGWDPTQARQPLRAEDVHSAHGLNCNPAQNILSALALYPLECQTAVKWCVV